jgi:hypothetical protein
MKTRLIPAFAAILAVTAVAGGWRDAPITPAPEEAGLGASARWNVSLTPLTFIADCYRWGGGADCMATVSGGTPPYTFQWVVVVASTYQTYQYSSEDAITSASAECPWNWQFYGPGHIGLTVTDSDGHSAYGAGYGPCTQGNSWAFGGGNWYDS